MLQLCVQCCDVTKGKAGEEMVQKILPALLNVGICNTVYEVRTVRYVGNRDYVLQDMFNYVTSLSLSLSVLFFLYICLFFLLFSLIFTLVQIALLSQWSREKFF